MTINLERKKKGREDQIGECLFAILVSSLKSCGYIFDEKSGGKKKEQIQVKTNRRMPIFDSVIQLVVVNLYTKFKVSILNGCRGIFDEKSGKKEKGREEQIEECLFATSQYNLSLRMSIPNFKFLP